MEENHVGSTTRAIIVHSQSSIRHPPDSHEHGKMEDSDRLQVPPLWILTRSTTQHILNGCQTALLQCRYTWRHDSVLHELVSTLHRNVPEGSMVYIC